MRLFLTLLLALLSWSGCQSQGPLLRSSSGTGLSWGVGAEAPASPAFDIKLAPKQRNPFSQASLMKDVRHLCSDEMAGRGSYQRGSALASQFLFDALGKLGYEMHRQPIEGYAETIIAVKRGDEKAVLVTAHHDHLGRIQGEVFRGADDNASGVAAMLAMARWSADKPFRHTILFVSFGAEEEGLVGSGRYIEQPYWPLRDTIGVVNFDMVGRNFYESGSNQPAALAVIGLEDDPDARSAAFVVAKQMRITLIDVQARLLEIFALHDRTDDWWFRRQGIPSIHFSTGMHRDYHRQTDTVDKLVPAQMAAAAKIATTVLESMAKRKLQVAKVSGDVE